jgi:hypothetical protein
MSCARGLQLIKLLGVEVQMRWRRPCWTGGKRRVYLHSVPFLLSQKIVGACSQVSLGRFEKNGQGIAQEPDDTVFRKRKGRYILEDT